MVADTALSDQDYLRFGRQILLPDWGEKGQLMLANSTALIVGLGGLGCPALQYLAGAGVGRLILADGDRVSLSNLPRQILYRPDQVGQLKTEAASQWVLQHNPQLQVDLINQMIDAADFPDLLDGVDVVLDCSDNFATRHLLNQASVHAGVPLISAAAIGWQGQLLAVNGSGPCFHCLTGGNESQQQSCAEAGVVGPVLGTVASSQALMAIRSLLGLTVTAQLQRFDGELGHWTSFALSKNPECEVCSTTVCAAGES